MRPADTYAEAWEIVERVRRSIALRIMTQQSALSQIRRLDPDDDDRKHRLRLAARYIDAATMKKAFGFVDDGT